MIVDAIADLHGHLPKMKGGDVLLMCGDYTARGKLVEWAQFFRWLKDQEYGKKIIIGGNHDNFLESSFPKTHEECERYADPRDFSQFLSGESFDFEYLCDSGCEIEGLKIWGSPWSVLSEKINPSCRAFMLNESKLDEKFKKIPSDTDILITHSPPYMILDRVEDNSSYGSMALRYEMDTRVFPKYHFFGHIHENHSSESIFHPRSSNSKNDVKCFNVSLMDENYYPIGRITRIEI